MLDLACLGEFCFLDFQDEFGSITSGAHHRLRFWKTAPLVRGADIIVTIVTMSELCVCLVSFMYIIMEAICTVLAESLNLHSKYVQ